MAIEVVSYVVTVQIYELLAAYERIHDLCRSAEDLPFAKVSLEAKAAFIRKMARSGLNHQLQLMRMQFNIEDKERSITECINIRGHEALELIDRGCCVLEPAETQSLARAILPMCISAVPSVFTGAGVICEDTRRCPRDVSCGETPKCTNLGRVLEEFHVPYTTL